jgi:proline iminopeptidase
VRSVLHAPRLNDWGARRRDGLARRAPEHFARCLCSTLEPRSSHPTSNYLSRTEGQVSHPPRVPPIPAPVASGFTTTTAVPLYWCRYGEPGAPRLLVLHGGPGASHDYLLPQMLALAESHELIFYDQRGGGRSRTDDREPITWRTHVADLDAVVAEFGLGAPSIVGYSWGGLLALLATIDRAERSAPMPTRLVLIDPAPLTRQFRERFEAEFARRQNGSEVQAMRAELAASGLRERDAEAYKHRMFELSVAGYFADPRAARDLTPFRVMGRVQQSVWESLGDFDVASRLKGVRVPAIFLHGRQDPIPLESSELGAAAMDALLVVIEGSGHVPYVEQPAALFAAIDQFLSATAGG